MDQTILMKSLRLDIFDRSFLRKQLKKRIVTDSLRIMSESRRSGSWAPRIFGNILHRYYETASSNVEWMRRLPTRGRASNLRNLSIVSPLVPVWPPDSSGYFALLSLSSLPRASLFSLLHSSQCSDFCYTLARGTNFYILKGHADRNIKSKLLNQDTR